MIEETRYKETPTEVERSRLSMGGPEYAVREPESRPGILRSMNWGPIWCGVVAAVGLQVIFIVLGMAVGLSVSQGGVATTTNNGGGLGVASGIWWVVSAIVALFLGGWLTGYLASPRKKFHAAISGFVMWAVITAISAGLVATAGGAALGGSLGSLGNTSGNSMAGANQNNLPPAPGEFTQGNAESPAGAAWWTFVVLVLSAAAATLGGAIGPRSEYHRRMA